MKWLVPKHRLGSRQLSGGAGSDGKRDFTPWQNAKFDESTGQVYFETTAAIQSSADRDWARQSRVVGGRERQDSWKFAGYVKSSEDEKRERDLGNYQKYVDRATNLRVRDFNGVRSLQDTAIECLLENLSDISHEAIECLPTPIVRRLWHVIKTRCSMCFNTWSIFSKILNQGDTSTLDLMRYHQAIPTPNCPLHIYTNPVTSKSFDFITSLSITVSFPTPHLIKLSGVVNLGVLEIINTRGYEDITVGDRLMRAWHEAAVKDGAFSVLRILKLWNHEGLTSKSLIYLDSFPSLAIYDVQGCGFDFGARIEARQLGWKPTLDPNILGLLEAACLKRAASMRASLGTEAKSHHEFDPEQFSDGAKVRRMPRAQVPAFLVQKLDKPAVECEASPTERNLDRLAKAYKKFKMKDGRRKVHDRQRLSIPQAWDLPAYKSFARIGQLRNDGDLFRAGVVIADQAVAGNELVNSVPMASLRLGPSPSWLEPSSTNRIDESFSSSLSRGPSSVLLPGYGWKEDPLSATSSLRCLAFIRIKPPAPVDVTPRSDGEAFLRSGSRSESVDTPAPAQPAPLKRQASGILRYKKRKLDDVLNSFD